MPQWPPYVLAKFGEVGSTHPWELSVSCVPPPRKLHFKTCYIVILFRSNFVQSLNAWRAKCCRSSRSRDQRSRSQCDITREKLPKSSIILPQIARFRSNFVQTLITWCLMYYKLSRSTGQRSMLQGDITYQHKTCYNSGTDKLSKVKLRDVNGLECTGTALLPVAPDPTALPQTP